MLLDSEIEDRAAKAYKRWCLINGFIYDYPSSSGVYVDGKTVIVGNNYRVLARYSVSKSGKLRKLNN